MENQRSLCNNFLETEVVVNGVCSDGSHLSGWISFPWFFALLKTRLCFEGFFILRWFYQFSHGWLMYLLLFFHTEVNSQEKLVTLEFCSSKETLSCVLNLITWMVYLFLLSITVFATFPSTFECYFYVVSSSCFCSFNNVWGSYWWTE